MTALLETEVSSLACQRWAADGRQTWTTDDPTATFRAGAYEVRMIDSDNVARDYITRRHYSGTYPAAVHRFGLYRAGDLVGVAVYSIPVQVKVLTNPLPDLQPYTESLELGRFVLGDSEPGNTESWFLGQCHRALYDLGIRGVVSFADPVPRRAANGTVITPGHVGFIYQATNAIYTGRATSRAVALLRDGSVISDRSLQKIRAQEQGHEYVERLLTAWGAQPMREGDNPKVWLREALAAAGAARMTHRGNHRYVFALGGTARLRRRVRITGTVCPYPKRVD